MKPWGDMTPEDIQAAIIAPEGEAAKIIRKYDPAWGRKGEELFEVFFVKKVTKYHNCKIKISAASKENAKEIAKDLMRSRHNHKSPISFDYLADSEDEEIYIEDIKKL